MSQHCLLLPPLTSSAKGLCEEDFLYSVMLYKLITKYCIGHCFILKWALKHEGSLKCKALILQVLTYGLNFTASSSLIEIKCSKVKPMHMSLQD